MAVPDTFLRPSGPLDLMGGSGEQELVKGALVGIAGLIPVVGGVAGGIVKFILDSLWPKKADPDAVWKLIEDRVKRVVSEELTKFWDKIVHVQLAGIKSLWADYADRAAHGSAQSARTAFDSARSAILHDYEYFTDKDYGHLTLPLFAQMGNLHICLLRDGIHNAVKLGFESKDVELMRKELQEVAVGSGGGKNGKYAQYVFDTYEAGVKKVKDKVGYQCEMHISAIEYAKFYWPVLGDPDKKATSVLRQHVVYMGPWATEYGDSGYKAWESENIPYVKKTDPGKLQEVRVWTTTNACIRGIRQLHDGKSEMQGWPDAWENSASVGAYSIRAVQVSYPPSWDTYGAISVFWFYKKEAGGWDWAGYHGGVYGALSQRVECDPGWELCDVRVVSHRFQDRISGVLFGFQPTEKYMKPPAQEPPRANAFYTVLSHPDGQALDLARYSAAEPVPVALREVNGSDSQVWQLQEAGEHTWHLVNAYNGRVLAVRDGEAVTLATKEEATATTRWAVHTAEDGTHRLAAHAAAPAARLSAAGSTVTTSESEEATAWVLLPVPTRGPVADIRATRPALRPVLVQSAEDPGDAGLTLALENPEEGSTFDGWTLEFFLPTEAGAAFTTAEDDAVVVESARAEERGTHVTVRPRSSGQALAPGDSLRFTLNAPSPAPRLSLSSPAAARLDGIALRS
ncbi:hypothetical protein D7294_30905 [Streptomyces hoynatensis]|uniref:Ricin B lectin domain-containing protein n=1 Tax=Streptomyces hoynatensis TaxID=1141874 RepID=A0A3A9YF24_9ACTN|nr:hypothetical protein D7294_30905 [Streptomyces hoynatensis]